MTHVDLIVWGITTGMVSALLFTVNINLILAAVDLVRSLFR